MQPVVDGLEAEYGDQIDFLSLDAAGAGQAAFRAYRLRGHPSYVLLNPAGEQLWAALGTVTAGDIQAELESALARQPD